MISILRRLQFLIKFNVNRWIYMYYRLAEKTIDIKFFPDGAYTFPFYVIYHVMNLNIQFQLPTHPHLHHAHMLIWRCVFSTMNSVSDGRLWRFIWIQFSNIEWEEFYAENFNDTMSVGHTRCVSFRSPCFDVLYVRLRVLSWHYL